MKSLHTLLFILSLVIQGYGQQDLSQTIRGRIIDQDTKFPIIGATITILESDPLRGTSSDLEGYFTLEQVKIGRVSLKVNYVGYEEKIIPNLVVNSGKEVILTIEILESVVRLEEITITAGEGSKNEALNEMTLTSARTFTVEETKRFAGTLNDPARMAANYAGAVSSPSGNNDIIVRGNSPKGILWRLEGIEIPNPNHFAGEGATGGPINALNSSMLANSDFLTGAFSPEYGNALSGIFDMKLRQGNSEKREYDISIGVIGIDMTLEGPFAKGKRASYLLNARYSSLEILDRAGLVDFGGVPRYKDLSFKFHFPTKKLGAFSLFGLGGKSDISLDSVTNRQRDFSEIRVLSNSGANLGVVGLNHVYFLNENFYVSSFASVATNGMESLFQNIHNTSVEYGSYDLQTKQAIRTGTSLNKKLNARNKIQAGFIYSYQDFSFDQQYEINDTLYTALDEKNEAGLLQAYISWKRRFNNKITLVNGIHNTLFSLNNSFAIEPRTSLEWKIKENQTFNMGAGLHSKPQTLPAYFVSINNESGVAETPNKDLKLTKAAHFVTGYSIMFGPVTHLKIEAYYQHLFHVPVEADPRGNESLINSIDFYDLTAFVSKGTGQNYGLELTLEKFLSHHFYYLFTSSLYESKYQALDGITRNTRWNANYASNFLIGKEFVFAAKKNKERVIGLNAKVSLLGGNRFNPINLEQSRAQTAMIRYDDPPYTKKGDDIFLLNAGVSYKVNRKNATHEIKLEVLNATNHASKVDEYYAPWTQEIVEIKQWPLLPNIIYRVQF